ncbi:MULTISPECIES: hypothetical protein [Bacillus]|uniref:hypothetical protein n=1 Tax=Bacillus TaxID=1386 RepID=UPI000BB733D6|nr:MULTISPECIES: hypothetical protein [Bacillus]
MSKEKEHKINFSVLYNQEGIKPDEEFVDALEEKLNKLEKKHKNRRTSIKIPFLTASAVIIAAIIFISFIQSSTVDNLINRPATENPQPPVIEDKNEQDKEIDTPNDSEEAEFNFDELFIRFSNLEEIYNNLIDSYDVVLANHTIGYLKALSNQDIEQVKKYTQYANVDHLLEKYKHIDFHTIELVYPFPSWKEPNLTFMYEKDEEYVWNHSLTTGIKYTTDITPVYQDESKVLISERFIREQASWRGIDFEAKGNNDITITSSFAHSNSQSLEEVNTLIATTIELMQSKVAVDTRVEVLYHMYPYFSMVLVDEAGTVVEGTLVNVEKLLIMKMFDRYDDYTNYGSLDSSIIENLDGMLEFVNEVYNLGWTEVDLEQASFYFDEERQVRLIVEVKGETKYLPLTHAYLNSKASYQ